MAATNAAEISSFASHIMASSSSPSGVDDHKALTDNAAFMDKYSRQIGAFGMEAMSKLIQLKVSKGVPVAWWIQGGLCGVRVSGRSTIRIRIRSITAPSQ